MEIQEWPLERIKPSGDNPRRITPMAVQAVAQSILKFGFRQPIVVDQNDEIVVGHVRYYVARKLEHKTAPVIVANLTEAEAKAYRIADNRTNELTDWNEDALIAELHKLDGAKEPDFEKLADMTQIPLSTLEALMDKGVAPLPRKRDVLDAAQKGWEGIGVVCPKCGRMFDVSDDLGLGEHTP